MTQGILSAYRSTKAKFLTEIYSPETEDSVYNRLPDSPFKENMLKVNEELIGMDEEELEQIIKPTELVNTLRHSFWTEAMLSLKYNRPIVLQNIYSGICNIRTFEKKMTPHNLAWVLYPILNYETKLEVQHYKAFEAVSKILRESEYDEKGKLNYNIIRLKLEIFKFLDERRYGGAVQRTLNVNKNITEKTEENPDKPKISIADLEKELAGGSRVVEAEFKEN